MKKQINQARVEEIKNLRYSEKMTLQEIADKYSLSRERVRQILGNSGTGYKTGRQSELILSHPELTNTQLAEKIGINKDMVSRYRSHQRHAIEDGALKNGTDIEILISNKLNAMGIENELMPHHHPFDILMSNGKRIDVKSTNKKIFISKTKAEYYNFKTEKTRRGNYTDYFIMYIVPEDLCLVVPFDDAPKDMLHFNYPVERNGKFTKFINNFEVLK